MVAWMEEHEYESVTQLKGSLSQMNCADPSAFERAQYMKALAHTRLTGNPVTDLRRRQSARPANAGRLAGVVLFLGRGRKRGAGSLRPPGFADPRARARSPVFFLAKPGVRIKLARKV